MFEYQIISGEEKVIVFFRGDMDIEITELLEEEVIPALQNYSNIELNFNEVPFVDSTGIGLLISLVQVLTSQNVTIAITQLTPQVAEVFDLLQIQEILGRNIFIDAEPTNSR